MAVGGGGKRYIMVSWNGWCVWMSGDYEELNGKF